MVNHGVRVVFAEVSAVCGFGTPLGRLLKLLWFPHKAYCASSVPSASAAGRGVRARGAMPAVASNSEIPLPEYSNHRCVPPYLTKQFSLLLLLMMLRDFIYFFC